MIATDGVFSMDGNVAKLDEICDLAEEYDALVMVDDSHATGFIGTTGRGRGEHCGVMGRVDIITSTLGKALGGASGGFTTGAQGDHRSAAAALAPVPLLEHDAAGDRRARRSRSSTCSRGRPSSASACRQNTKYFRERMTKAGFNIKPSEHPIVPVMLGDAKLAQDDGREAARRGHLRDRLLLSRSCRRARRASACRSRPRTRRSSSTRRSRRSRRSARELGVIS